jgi:hypothetical protein
MVKILSGVLLATVLTANPYPARSETAPAADPAVAAAAPAELSTADRDRLVQAFNRWAAGLRTLKAGGKARVGADGETTRAFRFSLVLARPASARLQGRWGSLASLFDLSGDDGSWVLYLPQDQAMVRSGGDGESVGLLLPPREILSVLLPTGIPPRDLAERGAAVREGDRVRLVVPPGKGGAGSAFHRVLWLDPEDGKPYRVEVRGKTQLEEPILFAEYGAYEGSGPDAFPAEVAVHLREGGQWARFSFETIRLNGEVSPGLFTLNVPGGTREIQAEDVRPDFLPEAEAVDEAEPK